jgi:hypothetical protein
MIGATLLLLLLPATPARGAVLESTPGGFTLENRVEVPADTAVTWRALVDDIDRWWPRAHTWWGDAVTIEPWAGGCFCERKGEREALHMQVAFVDPGRLLRMTGGLGPLQGMGLHGVLEFRLTPNERGTAIVMWYRAGGYTPDDLSQFATAVDRVQAEQLEGLAQHLRAANRKPRSQVR